MSKKLQHNGLWESSRMMLPQHKEQSLHLGQEISVSEPPTAKELHLMRDSIILPVTLEIMHKKRMELEMTDLMLKGAYLEVTKILIRSLQKDWQKTKKALIEHKIRLQEDSRDTTQIIYRYLCRDYVDQLVITKDHMRDEIGRKIDIYIKNLIGILQEREKKYD